MISFIRINGGAGFSRLSEQIISVQTDEHYTILLIAYFNKTPVLSDQD